MKLSLRSTRQGIAREGGSVFVEVSLDPGRAPEAREPLRRPVALGLVFDRSGSMGEEAGWPDHIVYQARTDRPVPPPAGCPPIYGHSKMDYVKAAAHALVDSLRDGDQVALVSFSSTARVEAPMTVIGPWSRNAFHQAIASFRPESSTNLYEGLVLGERQFGHALPSTHNCKIILLSDGLANVGVTSLGGMADFALTANRRGVTVSALGVGLDYSAELMGTLAQNGGGRFHHIADPARLPRIILAELESAALVLARRVTLDISAGPLVAVGENLNSFPQQPGLAGAIVTVGDLVGGRNLIFEVSTPGGVAGEAVSIRVTARWEDANKAARESVETLTLPVLDGRMVEALPLDAQLVEEVARLLEARVVRQASGAYDVGDLARTQASVAGGMAAMERLACAAPAMGPRFREAEGRLRDLGGRFARSEVTRGQAKAIYSGAFEETAGPREPEPPASASKPKRKA